MRGRDRDAQGARAHLEARALRGRHARVGGSHPRPRPRSSCPAPENRVTLRPVRPRHRVPAHLGHRPVQLPVPVLHAARGAAVAAQAEILRYEEIAEVVRQLAPLGLRRCASPAASPPFARARGRWCACCGHPGHRGHCALHERREAARDGGALADAGLDRVNISADSLRPDRVVAIARRDLGFDLVRAARRRRRPGSSPSR
jgi:hypothetical protein